VTMEALTKKEPQNRQGHKMSAVAGRKTAPTESV
jgi:hypothetical protein